jgi:hypothetical protein
MLVSLYIEGPCHVDSLPIINKIGSSISQLPSSQACHSYQLRFHSVVYLRKRKDAARRVPRASNRANQDGATGFE